MEDRVQYGDGFFSMLWLERAECAHLESRIALLREKLQGLEQTLDREEAQVLAQQLHKEICGLKQRYSLWEQREKEVERVIEQVSDPKQRMVLRLRYLCLLRWKDIQQRLEEQNMYYSLRQIFNFHAMGLENARSLQEKESVH